MLFGEKEAGTHDQGNKEIAECNDCTNAVDYSCSTNPSHKVHQGLSPGSIIKLQRQTRQCQPKETGNNKKMQDDMNQIETTVDFLLDFTIFVGMMPCWSK